MGSSSNERNQTKHLQTLLTGWEPLRTLIIATLGCRPIGVCRIFSQKQWVGWGFGRVIHSLQLSVEIICGIGLILCLEEPSRGTNPLNRWVRPENGEYSYVWVVQVELARKRGWKGYWVCLKGTTLLFYPCDSREVRSHTYKYTDGGSPPSMLAAAVAGSMQVWCKMMPPFPLNS